MAKIGRFLHINENETQVAAVGTAYNLAKIHTIDTQYNPGRIGTEFRGYLEQITMQVGTINLAANVTFKITMDAAGDQCVVPSTEVPIEIGTTTATAGTCIVKIDVPVHAIGVDLFLFVKVDAGTVTLTKSTFAWSE